MAQVQINLRCSPEELAAIDAARGGVKRNAFCLGAVMARVGEVGVAPVAVPVEAPLSRPSARAPRGCRVVGVPRDLMADLQASLDEAIRDSPSPGQLTVDEVIANVD